MPEKTTCPTCGQAVEVYTSDEGTSSYVKAAEVRVAELEDAGMALLAAYEAEEAEQGFPFNFELREAHRRLAATVHVEKKGDRHD